jgi:hypothetical protein
MEWRLCRNKITRLCYIVFFWPGPLENAARLVPIERFPPGSLNALPSNRAAPLDFSPVRQNEHLPPKQGVCQYGSANKKMSTIRVKK